MKTIPLLFQTEMIRALQREIEQPGTGKTMTRRIVKNQPPEGWDRHCWFDAPKYGWTDQPCPTDKWHIDVCRYGRPGDLIWCRETYFAWGRWETRFSAKKGRDEWHFVDMTLDRGLNYQYSEPDGYFKGRRGEMAPIWWKRPSIFMPKAASRITLHLTGVRVEKLRDIDHESCYQEGIEAWLEVDSNLPVYADGTPAKYNNIQQAFQALWQSINGAERWDANPWVWVLEFRPILANVNAVLASPAQFGIREAA